VRTVHLLIILPSVEGGLGDPTSISHLVHLGPAVVMGRGPTAGICVRDSTISRHHASFHLTARGLFVTDLHSSNGTRLEGTPLLPNEPTRVHDGQVLHVGGVHVRCTFVGADRGEPSLAEPSLPQAEFAFLSKLGQGSYGEVWAAYQELLGRMVAVKVLHPDARCEHDSNEWKRFMREAQLCSKVHSPYVVKIHDVRLTSDGIPCLIMEFVEGPSALEVVRSGSVSVAEAVGIAADVAEALLALDELGIVHRDIKPGNVLVAAECAKLADFGIAKDLSPGPMRDLTESGVVLGSMPYMAPEQLDQKKASSASDLYGLGATLYHLLGGAPPFPGRVSSTEGIEHTRQRILAEPPPSLLLLRPDCPPEVAELVHKLLSKAPAERGRVHEVATQLRRLAGTGPAPQPTPSETGAVSRPRPRPRP
jgi:serine/threonine protein kinase